MYFDEFKEVTMNHTSELFLAIFDSAFQFIPCAKSYLVLKTHYRQILFSRFPDKYHAMMQNKKTIM